MRLMNQPRPNTADDAQRRAQAHPVPAQHEAHEDQRGGVEHGVAASQKATALPGSGLQHLRRPATTRAAQQGAHHAGQRRGCRRRSRCRRPVPPSARTIQRRGSGACTAEPSSRPSTSGLPDGVAVGYGVAQRGVPRGAGGAASLPVRMDWPMECALAAVKARSAVGRPFHVEEADHGDQQEDGDAQGGAGQMAGVAGGVHGFDLRRGGRAGPGFLRAAPGRRPGSAGMRIDTIDDAARYLSFVALVPALPHVPRIKPIKIPED